MSKALDIKIEWDKIKVRKVNKGGKKFIKIESTDSKENESHFYTDNVEEFLKIIHEYYIEMDNKK